MILKIIAGIASGNVDDTFFVMTIVPIIPENKKRHAPPIADAAPVLLANGSIAPPLPAPKQTNTRPF
jgi:hypothetical protein